MEQAGGAAVRKLPEAYEPGGSGACSEDQPAATPCPLFTFRAAGGMRRGNMGHLTRIANAVVQALERGPAHTHIHAAVQGEPPTCWPLQLMTPWVPDSWLAVSWGSSTGVGLRLLGGPLPRDGGSPVPRDPSGACQGSCQLRAIAEALLLCTGPPGSCLMVATLLQPWALPRAVQRDGEVVSVP